MGNLLIYETENFVVEVPAKPHVSREDGGHIKISPKKRYFVERTELNPNEAIEVMRLTMLIGKAMTNAMRRRGIEIERINYQDNGNWAFLKNKEPHFHIHLYGRTKESKIQKWGESLYFPDPSTDFYKNFISLNTEDILEIKKEISNLEKEDKFNLDNWKL